MTLHPAYKPWLWCIVWLVIGWVAIFEITSEYWPRLAGISEADSRARQQREKPGSIRIIALGDSLLQTSISRPKSFNKMLPDNIFWSQMVTFGKDWRVIEPMLFKVSELQPDILLIQDQLLLQRGSQIIGFFVTARTALVYAAREVLGLKGERLDRAIEITPVHEEETDNVQFVEGRYRNKNLIFDGRYRNNIPIHSSTIEFLKDLKKTAPRFVVFRLPHVSALEETEMAVQWRETLADTLSQLDIRYVTVGASLADDQYSDGSHPNRKGRAIREEQLRELIGNLQE